MVCFALLSVHSSSRFDLIYNHISRSRYTFMGSADEEGPYGRGRYSYVEVHLSQWRKGSQWFEINRKLSLAIIEDTIYYRNSKTFVDLLCYVDEHYFPTMLSIYYPHWLANQTLTWTDWSIGGAHPATFDKTDITERFLEKLPQVQPCFYNDQPSQVCYLFARKFAPSALESLPRLAPKALVF